MRGTALQTGGWYSFGADRGGGTGDGAGAAWAAGTGAGGSAVAAGAGAGAGTGTGTGSGAGFGAGSGAGTGAATGSVGFGGGGGISAPFGLLGADLGGGGIIFVERQRARAAHRLLRPRRKVRAGFGSLQGTGVFGKQTPKTVLQNFVDNGRCVHGHPDPTYLY